MRHSRARLAQAERRTSGRTSATVDYRASRRGIAACKPPRQAAYPDVQVTLSPAPTLAEIADRVSTHLEAVSRELSRLGSLGLIAREGGVLRITNTARLADLVRELRGD